MISIPASLLVPDPAPAFAELTPRSVAVVLGTRPEYIKLSVLIHLLGPAARITHSGQHYDPSMVGAVSSLSGHHSEESLRIGGQHRGVQIGAATSQLTKRWQHDRPSAVIVQGDTNTALAGALAANAHRIPLIHVEAGLRSGDRDMPEEHNRILIDHLSDLCCAPTPGNAANLRAEAVPEHRIQVTGNPIVEAVQQTVRDDEQARRILGELDGQEFALATIHRPENVDDSDRLAAVLAGLAGIGVPVLLSLHPRTRDRIREFGQDASLRGLKVCVPPDYPVFLALMGHARILISDSGGIQEEATVVKKPLIVLRKSTERPETLGTFGRITASPAELRDLATDLLKIPDYHQISTPYGDGSASQRIFEAIASLLSADLQRNSAA